jgi:cytochrome c biogenesis protein CcmG/thiol:disulfide interchange protein DsbE
MIKFAKPLLLVVAAVVAGQLLVRGTTPAPHTVHADAAPPLLLPDLAGRAVDLAKLRGKVVAVNFWATWCPPCRAEIPELAQVWTEQRGRCFELLGVAEESAREDVARMAPSMPYPVLLDERAEAVQPWGVQGYPVTFLVDTEGRVRNVFTGGVEKPDLEAAIKPLLPATCPAS